MTVFELRVALTVEDFDRAVAFYRDGLGLEPGELWTEGGRGQMFLAGRATLEIFDPDYAAGVDQIEVGERVSGPLRFAFQVPDVEAAVERALQYGAELVHPPVRTPWNDLNARVRSPEGLQVTLYQAG
jgi:catechol 2,3-dioxygenase-like lactoylglutathione lyase family enzyme